MPSPSVSLPWFRVAHNEDCVFKGIRKPTNNARKDGACSVKLVTLVNSITLKKASAFVNARRIIPSLISGHSMIPCLKLVCDNGQNGSKVSRRHFCGGK